MKNKFKKVMFGALASAMIILSVTVGNGKVYEVNKSETHPSKARAAGFETVTEIFESEGDDYTIYGEIGPDDANELASLSDAEMQGDEEDLKSADASKDSGKKGDRISEKLEAMSVEEKVAQLFIVTPEALTDSEGVVMAGDTTKEAIDERPVGGVIYMGDNLQSKTQVQEMLANTNSYSKERIGLPMFLCVDEEGGSVARIAGSGRFDVERVGNMADVGATGDEEKARAAGVIIGSYLSELGFNVDFAPVADVLTNTDNSIVRYRSFGTDSDTVSDMSVAMAEGLGSKGLEAVYKHFPGHGATAGDTHIGAAFTNKTVEELSESELIPFQHAIDNGAEFIMVSHISAPAITGHDTPASLSDILITDILRGDMGYDGIVVTDAMEMGAISQKYSSGEAAKLAIEAGADIILMPENFGEAYDSIVEAVNSGEISEERLDQSVRRILEVKYTMGTNGKNR